MTKQTIRDIEVQGLRVFLRVDYNVQFVNGQILDDHRLRESLGTIRELRERGAKVIICSHRGRPHGEVVPELSNRPVAEHLATLMEGPIAFVEECIGPLPVEAIARMAPGDLLLLENVRFHAGEEGNEDSFARALAELADIYVNDAFGTAHRAHASIVGVPRYLPGVAGLLLERELAYLAGLSQHPERPFALVLGGAKVADKIGILQHLGDKADFVLIGGGIANTFLKAQGIDVGASLVEDDRIDTALDVMRQAAKAGRPRLVMPRDVVIADAQGENVRTVSVNRVPPGFRILDIGGGTLDDFRAVLQSARTVVWNGPMGFFEREPFDHGSLEVATILGSIKATTVVGGGETAAAVARAGMSSHVSHVSTGGGASLAMLQGEVLPGVAALRDVLEPAAQTR
ncbi:MAG: phosphoglycerate kinase [Chloroflexi bacterium]|nr:phosphoglycerate kinase [Chloroflexota bacterium]MDA1004235.1 phosphoglycerate kinase [Chloroflexota bacterium]MQC28090.1 phosphoglycerate kinase [Chloroflexota bacterium]